MNTAPLACTKCEGTGITYSLCSRHHTGNCPCGPDEARCEACDGSGLERCQVCGEGHAVGVDGDGWRACSRCLVGPVASDAPEEAA